MSRSQSHSLGVARPVSGGATDMGMMEMDLEDEESTDTNDRHHYARTELATNAPTSTNIIIAGSSPSQEGFAGGFGAGLKSAVLHPTLSPRSPVGAGSNTCGDPGVSKSRVPERLTWCGGNDTPQAQAASASASAAGKARSRKQCGGCDCGSVIGRWGEVVPSGQSQDRANKSLSGKPCGSCGGYVEVGQESESRLQDWSKTSTTIFTTPSAPERTIKGGHTIISDNNNKGIDKGAVPQEARLLCVAEDEDQAREARAKQRKRGREGEDSEPSTPLSSADSRRVRRRRGNDLITPMPRLSWGQSGHDSDGDVSATQTSARPSSGSVGGGGGGRGAGGMAAMPVETRSDPSSDPVSKRRKSDQSHGDGSPFKSSVMVAARSKYRIVQHRGFPESGETVVGSADGADSAHTGALGEATATGACKRSMYSPGMSSNTTTINSTNRRHDGRSSDLNNSSSSSYRRRYRDEYSKNKPRRRQSAAPSLLHKGSPEATGSCGAPKTPAVTVAVEAGDCTDVDPAIPILVVIDGSNVAFSFRQDVSKPRWSPQGILLAVKFFEERGVPVVAFVPRPRVDSIAPGSEHYDAFMHAMRSQAIATVPSKANDDLFILLYAIQRSAHIVSNDQFRDHLANASTLDSLGLTKDELRTFLVDHHVSYTFARDEFVANPEAAIIRMLTKQTAGVGSEVRRTGACTT